MTQHTRITCEYCKSTITAPKGANACFRCWELYEEKGGPQLDPETNPPEEVKS